MTKKVDKLKEQLKTGGVYRRADLALFSNAVDRHISELIKTGDLEKISAGVYYVPQKTVFGAAPPKDESLVRAFLKEDDFLLTSPNAYNSLGVGTTQLYNTRVVYNHKRHGTFDLGGRKFQFQAKHRFPQRLTPEFLLVDLVNNIDQLAEDKTELMRNVLSKAKTMDAKQLAQMVDSYGNAKARAFFNPIVNQSKSVTHAQ